MDHDEHRDFDARLLLVRGVMKQADEPRLAIRRAALAEGAEGIGAEAHFAYWHHGQAAVSITPSLRRYESIIENQGAAR